MNPPSDWPATPGVMSSTQPYAPTVSPDGLKVLAKAPVLQSNAWTAPSLSGTRLYVRDRKSILALDLK